MSSIFEVSLIFFCCMRSRYYIYILHRVSMYTCYFTLSLRGEFTHVSLCSKRIDRSISSALLLSKHTRTPHTHTHTHLSLPLINQTITYTHTHNRKQPRPHSTRRRKPRWLKKLPRRETWSKLRNTLRWQRSTPTRLNRQLLLQRRLPLDTETRPRRWLRTKF